MFLKSNRSRDTTPIHETGKLDEFRALSIPDETNKDSGDKLKSILREKQSEDGKSNFPCIFRVTFSNFNDWFSDQTTDRWTRKGKAYVST